MNWPKSCAASTDSFAGPRNSEVTHPGPGTTCPVFGNVTSRGVPVESPIIVGCGLRRLGAAAHSAACHGGDGVGFPVDEEQGSGPPLVGGWGCGEEVFWCWLGCGDDEGGVEKPGGFVEQPVDHVPAVGKTRPKHPARAFETVYEFREIFYVVCA